SGAAIPELLHGLLGADIPAADVIAHDDEDVRLLLLLLNRQLIDQRREQCRQGEPDVSPRRHGTSSVLLLMPSARGRPVGRPVKPRRTCLRWLVARVTGVYFFYLLEDLAEVIALRSLQRRELLVTRQMLEP